MDERTGRVDGVELEQTAPSASPSGLSEERRETLDPWPAQALHAALDLSGEPPEHGDPLPLLWTALFFKPLYRRGDLGADGAPTRGDALEATGLGPFRRQSAGRVLRSKPFRLGVRATRLTTLAQSRPAAGGEAAPPRLSVRHQYLTADGAMETEERDYVFGDARKPPQPDAGPTRPEALGLPEQPPWRRGWTADPVLLFRFAALTHDAHRVSYDADYARRTERLPGLLTPPALQALLLMDLLRERGPDKPVARLAYRALSPLYETEAFETRGRLELGPDGAPAGARLWVAAPDLAVGGWRLTLEAAVGFA